MQIRVLVVSCDGSEHYETREVPDGMFEEKSREEK